MKRVIVFLILVFLPIVQASFIEDFKEGLINDLPILEKNKYTFFILTLLIISTIVSVNYSISKKSKEKKDNKESHLFSEAIGTLGGFEKDICKILNETEGITEDYLSGKMEKDRDKIKKSLRLLEKRQIIKERKDESSKIYLSDWLK